MTARIRGRQRDTQRGATLLLVGLALTALLGIMALAIDLGMLYVARSEAQRAADAAALAGANIFVTSGCTSVSTGCVPGGPQEPNAAAQAIQVADKNYVAGQPAVLTWTPGSTCPTTSGNDICFSYPTNTEPQITVTVRRPGIQTIFAKLLGVSTAEVDATATAEAYNPTGGDTSQQVACVTPFLVPNCDPNHVDGQDGGVANSGCPSVTTATGSTATPNYFVYPGSNPPDTSVIAPTAEGESWFLHFGNGPSDAATPSEWYMVEYSNFPGFNSGSLLRQYISQCNWVKCGDTLPAVVGNKVGNIDMGVDERINLPAPPQTLSPCSGNPPTCDFSQGQDTITTANVGTPDFTYAVQAGQYNPYVTGGIYAQGANVNPSDTNSIVTAAVYSGQICSSTITTDCVGSGGGNVEVQGFMQLFLQGVTHQNQYDGVEAVVLNVSACGTPDGTTPPVTANGGAPVPIRLIQSANATP
jgi:hypothetical protein